MTKIVNKKILVFFMFFALLVTGLTYSDISADNTKIMNGNSNLVLKVRNKNDNKVVSNAAVFRIEDTDGNVVREKVTTDESGVAIIKGLAAGEYTLIQEKGANGEKVTDLAQQLITVEKSKVTVVDVKTAEKISIRAQARMAKVSMPKNIEVVAKEKATGTKITGAEYTVVNVDTKEETIIVTDAGGRAVAKDLAAGKYTVAMSKAPKGYLVSDNVREVDLSKGSAVVVSVLSESGNEDKSSPKRVLNKMFSPLAAADQLPAGTSYLRIGKIYKENGKNLGLEGAVFKITALSTGDSIEMTSDPDGEIELFNLADGEYLIKEISAPSGFEMIAGESEKTITLDGIGNVGVLNNKVDTPTDTGSLYLYKEGETIDPAVDAALEGVEFTLYKSDRTTIVGTYETDENGEIVVDNLPVGTYFWEETKTLNGYNELIGMEAVVIHAAGDTPSYYPYNDLTEVNITISKVDSEDNAPLIGATFKVTGPIGGNEREFTVTTPASGEIELPRTVRVGTYELEETGTPEGYQPITGTFNKTAEIGVENQTWTIENTPIGQFTVTYDANGAITGTVPTDTTEYASGAEVTVADKNTLTYDGHKFLGWSEDAAATTATYKAGDTFEISKDTTLYAVWQHFITVTYDRNGATGGAIPDILIEYYPGDTITVKGDFGLTKTNHTFAGWNTQADEKGTMYQPGETFVIGNESVILYAAWQEDTKYTITYNGNENTDGVAPLDSATYYGGSDVTLAGEGTLVKDNHSFGGWNTQADGKGTTYAAGDTFVISEDTTLYAVWVEDGKVTLTYNGTTSTSGTIPVDSNSPYFENTEVTVLDEGSLAKTDYIFNGWNTQADGKGTTYNAGDKFTITENTILYAMWKADAQYTVTYNGNGSDGGSVPVDSNSPYYVDSEVVVLGEGSLTYAGYSFVEWNTQADGNGASYVAGAKFVITEDTTLYAIWEETKPVIEKATIIFHKNHAEAVDGDIVSHEITLGNSLNDEGKELGNPTRAGYELVGWCTTSEACYTTGASGVSAKATGNQFDKDTKVTKSMTVYAQWEKLGGTGPDPEDPEIPEPDLPRTGADISMIMMLGVLGLGLTGLRLRYKK